MENFSLKVDQTDGSIADNVALKSVLWKTWTQEEEEEFLWQVVVHKMMQDTQPPHEQIIQELEK